MQLYTPCGNLNRSVQCVEVGLVGLGILGPGICVFVTAYFAPGMYRY